MAYKGKIVNNPKTGQSIEFITTADDSDGELLEMITTYSVNSNEPPAHYHPEQDEYFTILQGELTVKLKDRLIVLRKGESINLPRNTIHSMWNKTATKTIVNWKVMPALKTEYFMETFMGLAMDNKTNKNGMPGLLQAVLLVNKHSKEFRLVKPAYIIQKIVFGLLSPVAILAGKKANYRKYID